MKYVKEEWKFRVTIVLSVSIVVSVLMVMLDQTQWATNINAMEWHHGGEGKPDIPTIVLFILPFVKAIVLIGLPFLLARGVANLMAFVRRKNVGKPRGHK